MGLDFKSLVLTAALASGAASPALAGDAYVAIAISKPSATYGTGTGANKRAAIDAALADCTQRAGKTCGYYYWTKGSSHMAMLYCMVDMGGSVEEGAIGGHSTKSLAEAKMRALRSVKTWMLRNTYSHITENDCPMVASYSNGQFSGE